LLKLYFIFSKGLVRYNTQLQKVPLPRCYWHCYVTSCSDTFN